jgi:hypothetical protein
MRESSVPGCSLNKFAIEMPDGSLFVIKSTPFIPLNDRRPLLDALYSGSMDPDRLGAVAAEFTKQNGYTIATRVVRIPPPSPLAS